MSIYYILINKDKKEWINSGDLKLGIKDWAYKLHISTLLGYLVMSEHAYQDNERYDPKKHVTEADNENEANFYFQGHWAGDSNIELVSEYREEYEICFGYGERGYESKDWVNITIPLAREWNHEVKYWYEDSPDMQDWVKQNTYGLRVR